MTRPLVSSVRYGSRTSIDCFVIMQYIVISIVYLREYCLFFGLTQMASWLYEWAFVTFAFLLFLVCINSIIKRFKIDQIFTAVLGILLIVLILISAIKVIGFELTSKGQITVSQVLLLLYFILLPGIESNKSIFCYVCRLNIILSIIHMVMAFLPNSYFNGRLVYFYANPNESGLSLYLTAAYLFVYSIYCKGKKKYIAFLLLLSEIILCYLSGSRASLFSILMAFVVYLIMSKKKVIRIFPNMITIIILFSVIFPSIWVVVYKLVPDKSITFLGKPLFSGREAIWMSMIETIIDNPLRMHYKESIRYTTPGGYVRFSPSDYGPHNAFWGILWDYNIIILMLTVWIINKRLREVIKHIDSKFKLAMGTIIISLFVVMTFETTLLSAGFNYMFRSFYLLVFLKSKAFNSLI